MAHRTPHSTVALFTLPPNKKRLKGYEALFGGLGIPEGYKDNGKLEKVAEHVGLSIEWDEKDKEE